MEQILLLLLHHICFVLQCLKPCGRTLTHSWPWSCWKIARWRWSADSRVSFSLRTSSISSTSSWTPTKRTWCQNVLNGNTRTNTLLSPFPVSDTWKTSISISETWFPEVEITATFKSTPMFCQGRRGTRRKCWGSSRTRPTWSPCAPTRRRTARRGRSRSSWGKRRRRSGRVFLPRRGDDGWVLLHHFVRMWKIFCP